MATSLELCTLSGHHVANPHVGHPDVLLVRLRPLRAYSRSRRLHWSTPLPKAGQSHADTEGIGVSDCYAHQTYIQQAPWPQGEVPEGPLPKAAVVTLLQLAHTVGLLGTINMFVLWAARRHLWSQPAIQEKIAAALLTPLLLGDFLHIALTLWALGEERWDVSRWEGTLWITIVTGLTLMIPRIAWHLGVGRYVERRDGQLGKKH